MRVPFALVLVCIALTGCGRSGAPAEGERSATAGEPLPPDATPAPAPATRMPSKAAQPIVLPHGSTTAAVKGTLAADQDVEYVIGEEEGSYLLAHAVTPESDLNVSVYRADSGAKIDDQRPANPAFFVAELPATVGYLIVIHSTGVASEYSLDVEVPRRAPFDRDAQTTTITSTAPVGATVAYLVPAAATLSAELTEAPADAYLSVQQLSGRALLRADANSRSFSGALSGAKDMSIVRVNQGATSGAFSLKLERK